jgi:hypothetical protein
MSDALEELVKKAATDSAFAEELGKDPGQAFVGYPDLTHDEKAALTAIAAGANGPRGWLPGTYKDVGAGVLSILTALSFGVVLAALLLNIGTPPVFTVIPGSDPVQSISFQPFERVQVAFNAVLPLFGALFAFWLGVKVEGQRADAAEQRADSSDHDAKRERRKKEALLAVSTPDIVNQAKKVYPGLFAKEAK